MTTKPTIETRSRAARQNEPTNPTNTTADDQRTAARYFSPQQAHIPHFEPLDQERLRPQHQHREDFLFEHFSLFKVEPSLLYGYRPVAWPLIGTVPTTLDPTFFGQHGNPSDIEAPQCPV